MIYTNLFFKKKLQKFSKILRMRGNDMIFDSERQKQGLKNYLEIGCYTMV